MEDNKKKFGQFYTIFNPFDLKVFKDWFFSIPNVENLVLLEPFAGSNNIVKLTNSVGINNKWSCYDIDSTSNVVPIYKIIKQDTIENFPKGFEVCITNPPYLAKNSATRSNIQYQGDPYDDLYKKCLEVMLNNLNYVAAIIPESFITAGIFQERLDCVISLTCKMFDTTDCPVCLALFSNNLTNDFHIFRMDDYLGSYQDLLYEMCPYYGKFDWKINDPTGNIGIICIDNTKEESIKFVNGSSIDSNKIKNSSRSLTRISLKTKGIKINDMNLFLEKCNNFLKAYRDHTGDIFMTSFKGLREDGKYRRRLDFETAKSIMEKVLITFKGI